MFLLFAWGCWSGVAREASATVRFATPVSYATGTDAYSVLIEDFNQDGVNDLAVPNNGSASVSILLGSSDGTFLTGASYAVGNNPLGLATADLNGDGRFDLVVTNISSNTVSVLLGHGDGTFADKADFVTGVGPRSVAIGDLDADGTLDLVVVNLGSNSVSIMLGHGDGTFAGGAEVETSMDPFTVVLDYLDSDESLDFAVSSAMQMVSVWLGNGDGTFGVRKDFNPGEFPTSLAAADVNGDGTIDLVASNLQSTTVSVLLGVGDGTFPTRTAFGTGSTPASVVIDDFDQDGTLDLAVANSGAASISLLVGNGDGSFATKTDFPAGPSPFAVKVGDLNGDGWPDLVAANGDADSVFILLNGPPRMPTLAFSVQPSAVGLGATITPAVEVRALDENGNPGVGQVVWLQLDGTGTLTGAGAVVCDANGIASFGTLRVDTQGIKRLIADGENVVGARSEPFSVSIGPAADMIFTTQPSDVEVAQLMPTVHVRVVDAFGNALSGVSVTLALVGSGTLTGGAATQTDVAGVARFHSLSVDTPGSKRLVASCAGVTPVTSGSFEVSLPLFAAQTLFKTGSHPLDVAIADLNGDGAPDLAVPNQSANTVSVLLGNRDGTFRAKTDFRTGRVPSFVAIADLNGDGALDLTVVNTYNSISVLLGDGHGWFGANTDFVTGEHPIFAAIGDLNGDARPDVVVANYMANTLSVLLGAGDGTFGPRSDFGTGSAPSSLALADVDGDGSLDATVTNYTAGTISVLHGNGDGTLAAKTDFNAGDFPWCLAMGNLNGDANLDLVVSNAISNTVSIMPGRSDGSFGPLSAVWTGSRPEGVAIGDLNGDGLSDLAVVNEGSNTVSVMLGDRDASPSGVFLPRSDYATGESPRRVAIADLDGNGYPDLVVANYDSSTVSVLLNTTRPPSAPLAPVLTSPEDGAKDVAVNVALSWTGPAVSYRLQISTDSLFADMVVDQANLTATSHWLTGLAGRTVHFWRVNATNGGGTSDYSPTRSFTTIDLATPTLLHLFRAVSTAAGVRVEWQLGDPIAFRSIELQSGASEAGSWSTVQRRPESEGLLSVVLDDRVTAGVERWYRLTGIRLDGRSVLFGQVRVGAFEPILGFELAPISPNPSSGLSLVMFAMPLRGQVRLSLTDVQGREFAVLEDGVREVGRHVASLNVSDLKAGIYFLRMQTPGACLTRRLAVVR